MILRFDQQIRQALVLPEHLELVQSQAWLSAFPVTEIAAMSIGSVALQLSKLMHLTGLVSVPPTPLVNARLSSLWFGFSVKPIGWQLPPVWDEFAGDYKTLDGWIRLHTNLPHHRAAALNVLGYPTNKQQAIHAVGHWRGEALESAIAAQNGVSATMHSRQEWQNHAHGKTLADQPLIDWQYRRGACTPEWQPSPERPLAGLKVLDLTRVLAGPVATRTLAGLGADVLRIDPPEWDEPNIVPDIALGKRCTRLDLRTAEGKAVFANLLSETHVLVHGYRADALEGLGLGKRWREGIAPDCLEVTLNAYGWQGPWQNRRGFDSLVQMSCGIADAGRLWAGVDEPHPLPVQALDHATGYLMAGAVLRALNLAIVEGTLSVARLSLARTANWLMDQQRQLPSQASLSTTETDFANAPEETDWGQAHRLKTPFSLGEPSHHAGLRWAIPARKLGRNEPVW